MAETPIDWPTNPMKAFLESNAGDAWRSAMLRQTERFWEAQRKLLDEYETLSRTLLERRRTATEAALETVRKMSACRDGADWAQCCSDWIAGSVARVAADGRDMLEESMKVLTDIGQSMSAGMSEAAETAAAKGAPASESVSARGVAIAQTAAAMQEAAARAGKAAPKFKKPEEGAHP